MTPPRVTVCGHNKKDLIPLLERYGFQIDEQNPEAAISYGGDGTLLGAERAWPGIPKVALRDSRHCRTCSHHSNEEILEHLAQRTLRPIEFMKIRATAGDREAIGLNDIILRNARVNVGMRFLVEVNGESYTTKEIVGDGLVIATPFGATAYFCSVAHCVFRTGIGIAFNNSTDQLNHLIVGEDSVIRVRVTRGPAFLAADNDTDSIAVDGGDEITVRRAKETATILFYDKLRFENRRIVY